MSGFPKKTICFIKNFRLFITFSNFIVRLYLLTLSILLLSSNLYLIHLLSSISYNIIDNLSIYLFPL